jgi:hypothetical protein
MILYPCRRNVRRHNTQIYQTRWVSLRLMPGWCGFVPDFHDPHPARHVSCALVWRRFLSMMIDIDRGPQQRADRA